MNKREFQLEIQDAVATVTFNWPDRVNAMGLDFSADFAKVLDRVEQSGARVMILTGSGRAFCGGGDLNEIMSPDATSRPQDSAISNTTSALLILPIFRLDDPRVSSFRISLRSARDD